MFFFQPIWQLGCKPGNSRQKGLQDYSGGNFDSFIQKEFSDRVEYCPILTINILPYKII